MNRRIRTQLLLLCTLLCYSANAQLPKHIDKAREAILTITTFLEDGSEKASGYGFIIDKNGTALSDYTLFRGAKRAVVTDFDGKQYQVNEILGANETYDVVKFKIDKAKKITALPLAKEEAKVNEKVYLLRYSNHKRVTGESVNIEEVTHVTNEQLPYYTLNIREIEKYVSSPVLNQNGEVIAMVQAPTSSSKETGYAVSIAYCNSLKINALSAGNKTLQSIGIRKALPNTEEEALVYLYTKSGQTSNQEEHLEQLHSFIATYPNNTEGYMYRAQYYARRGEYELAQEDMKEAERKANEKDIVHFNFSKLMTQVILQKQEATELKWTLERALEEIQKAIAINPQPIYLQHKADILYTLKRYQESYETYYEVTQTNLKSAQVFMYAAQAKKMTGVEEHEVLALQDSAIAQYKTPLPQEAAPYLLLRAKTRINCKLHRLAILDFNEYERLMAGHVGDQFYYERAQAEIACRMYLQALDDISKAVRMNPQDPHYLCLYGSLLYSAEYYAEAIDMTQKAIAIAPDYADAHRILGVSLIASKEKEKGVESLKKAKELGDNKAQQLIEQHGY